MNLNATIKKYEATLARYVMFPGSNASTAADVKQLIEWLKDYKRLLKEEKNWKSSNDCDDALRSEKNPETITEFADRCRECGAKYGRLLKESESKSNESELKPCPFCGTEVKMRKIPLWHGSNGYHDCFEFEIKCPKCGCSVDYNHNDTIYRSEEEAVANVVKSWNERYIRWFERVKDIEETK